MGTTSNMCGCKINSGSKGVNERPLRVKAERQMGPTVKTLEHFVKCPARDSQPMQIILIHNLTSLLNDLFYSDAMVLHPYKPIGCFQDDYQRALPVLVREYSVKETDLANSFAGIIHACATEVYENGFWYFGVEYRYQCWSGVNGDKTYNRYGRSDNCLFNYSVGVAWTIFIYRFVEG